MRRRSTDGCPARDLAVIVGEMLVPVVQPRMKHAREHPGFWVQSGKVCSFAQIAVVTGERKISGSIGAPMLSREDVLDVENERLTLLWQGAILAVIVRTAADELAEGSVHQPALAWVSTRRALDCRIPMRVLA